MSQNPSTPLEYAEAAVDTMRRRFPVARDLPPTQHFHYHQGVFLSGVYQTYLLNRNEEYLQYVKDWVDSNIGPRGEVLNHDQICLDDIQPGILLFPLLELTDDPRYRNALDQLAGELRFFPKNDEGGFWHKQRVAGQMWLDGLYMGGPFMTGYGTRFNDPDLVNNAIGQALLMQEKTRVPEVGLWRHAYDPSHKADWADPETGLSPEFWGRSVGWVPVAILDELDAIDRDHPARPALVDLVRNLLTAVCNYQGPDGRWWQVLDKVGQKGNWPENSCTCLFVTALARAVRTRILDKTYLEAARKGYQGVIRSLTWKGDDLEVGQVCIGTGVGDYRHYCERPTSTNDLHGVGAFLLMCTRMQQVLPVTGQ
ncbi:glycoside hydrolase family 88/105 protein [Bifidobacterium indicum]|uniref:glycoside hydrolase family 88/105 protein n=1 Tax=Bifidobacterium indicum TaxID=1691 RepID=UPI002613EBE5|nr:glycoside hydrolase family 88 protein [uncultured Bifidobacterium sp.]